MPLGLGLAFSGLHFGTTVALLTFSISVTAATIEDPNAGLKPLADAARFLVNTLMQPIMSLWNSWMSQNIPNSVENLLFLLNSLLWGFCAAFLVRSIRSRRF